MSDMDKRGTRHQCDSGTEQAEKLRADLSEFVADREVVVGCSFRLWDEANLFESSDVPTGDRKPDTPNSPDFVLLVRQAHLGNASAINRLALYTRALSHELELVSRKHEAKVMKVAASYFDWPVVLSLDSARQSQVARLLKKLDVGGDKASRPAYPLRRSDSGNFWTYYAQQALACLRINRRLMPTLLVRCKRARRIKTFQLKLLNTPYTLTGYDVGQSVILTTDWQEKCVSLPTRLTQANVRRFVSIAKLAIRELWCNDAKTFSQVKTHAEKLVRFKTDGEFIDRALAKIAQAMRGLAHK